MIKPIHDRVSVKLEPKKEKVTLGGIHLTTDSPIKRASVLAVGSKVEHVQVGDVVTFYSHACAYLEDDVAVMKEQDILGVICD